MYDPKTKKLTTIDTCFAYGHINFDENDVLWSSFGPAGVEGWFDVKIWDKTHDEKAAQGWTAFVVDHNGNGKRDAYTEPNDPADATKDRRINVTYYGDSPAYDGSIWGSVQGMPGAVVRLVPGPHPPETALAEVYEVPWNNPKAPVQGFAPRGMDVDSNNVVWTVLSSGHLASFDRRKCKGPLNGPHGHRPALSGRLDAPSIARAQLQGRRGQRQRRVGVLRLRGPLRHAGRRQGHPHLDRQLVGEPAGPGRRPLPDAARAVSAGLLRQGNGRADRRSERRLEGQGDLHDVGDACAIPCRRWQGHHEQAGEVPDAAGSAVEVAPGDARVCPRAAATRPAKAISWRWSGCSSPRSRFQRPSAYL